MGKRIAVLGTGAIGSSVGADMTRAGFDVACCRSQIEPLAFGAARRTKFQAN